MRKAVKKLVEIIIFSITSVIFIVGLIRFVFSEDF